MADPEKQPLVEKKNVRKGTRALWLCLILFLLVQVSGLILFNIWAFVCFFREVQSTLTCVHFVVFSSPGIFESAWLSVCVISSLFLIYHICRRSPAFPGARVVGRHLKSKIYFWKILFVLLVVCIYDLLVMLDQPKTVKTASYILYIFEKVLLITVMFLVNFLPRFWNSEDVKLKWWFYKMALLLYSVHCYCLALLGSAIAVLTVSQPQTDQPGVEAVVVPMLLMTNSGLRYFVADVFLKKLFHQDLDILGSVCASTKISESIGVEKTGDNYIVTLKDSSYESM